MQDYFWVSREQWESLTYSLICLFLLTLILSAALICALTLMLMVRWERNAARRERDTAVWKLDEAREEVEQYRKMQQATYLTLRGMDVVTAAYMHGEGQILASKLNQFTHGGSRR